MPRQQQCLLISAPCLSGAGGWGTATSRDGIHFEPATLGQTSRLGAGTDGTGVFVDDDGTGYIVFAASPPNIDQKGHPWPGHPHALGDGHLVSIERLSPDLLTSSKVNVSGFFPDDFVESPSLFKRRGIYYVTYGSRCCGCKEGGGVVIFSSRSIKGPWVRQTPHSDLNCRNATAPICGRYSLRHDTSNDLVYQAQWWGPSFISTLMPNGTAETTILFVGRKWLSGPNLPPGCTDICGNKGRPDLCAQGGAKFLMKNDYSVWLPLEFDDVTGAIRPFRATPSFELRLAGPGHRVHAG